MFIVLTFKPKSVIYGINQQIKYIKVTIKKIFYVKILFLCPSKILNKWKYLKPLYQIKINN